MAAELDASAGIACYLRGLFDNRWRPDSFQRSAIVACNVNLHVHEYMGRNAKKGFVYWLQCLEGIIAIGMTSNGGLFNWKYLRRGVLLLEIPAGKKYTHTGPYRHLPPKYAKVRLAVKSQ